MSRSSSVESVNSSRSTDPSVVVVEMSSFSVETCQLETVTVESIYASNVPPKEDTNKSKHSILHAANVLLQIVLLISLLYFIVFLFMTGFSWLASWLASWLVPQNVTQLPKRLPMSDAFLQALRINSQQNGPFSLNFDQAMHYCLPPTRLTDCELDWSRLRHEMDSTVRFESLNFANSDHQCYISNRMFTCFGPFDGTHYEVVIMPERNWNHSSEIKIYAQYILAVDPYQYLLVTGDMPEQFCWIHLHGQSTCLNH